MPISPSPYPTYHPLLYLSQGDDFAQFLSFAHGNLVRACQGQVNAMRANIERLELLGSRLAMANNLVILSDVDAQLYEQDWGTQVDVAVEAKHSYITFTAHTDKGEAFLQSLVKEGILDRNDDSIYDD